MSGVETPTFENIDDIIQFGKKQGIVYIDDSMDIPDKIKMLTTIMSGIYFYYVVHVVEYSNLMKALNILIIYLKTIPNNSIEILNAKQSTYTGYKQLQNKAYQKMIENHPKLKNLSFEDWKKLTTYMGAWQSAHEGEQYDSEQLLAYANWAGNTMSSGFDGLATMNPEDADLDSWFLDVQREGSAGEWLSLDQDFDDI